MVNATSSSHIKWNASDISDMLGKYTTEDAWHVQHVKFIKLHYELI
jgi:hypothetical protein